HILEEEFNKDKRKAEVLGMTKLGLVEVARRREKESIDKYYLMILCHYLGTILVGLFFRNYGNENLPKTKLDLKTNIKNVIN
ncbi:hypothetical protein D1N53_24465, partial [Clostridioides difficile]